MFAELLQVADPANLIDRLFAGMRPDEAMLDAVAAAKRVDVRTGLISNSWGKGRYDRTMFPELFDGTVISGEVGVRKPLPEIYAMGAEAIGLAPLRVRVRRRPAAQPQARRGAWDGHGAPRQRGRDDRPARGDTRSEPTTQEPTMTTTSEFITATDFVGLPTRDVPAAAGFYGETLGLPRSVYMPDRGFSEFETGNLTLSVWNPEQMGLEHRPNPNPVALHVEDVAAVREALEGRGGKIPGRHPGHGRLPDGVLPRPGWQLADVASPLRAAGHRDLRAYAEFATAAAGAIARSTGASPW